MGLVFGRSGGLLRIVLRWRPPDPGRKLTRNGDGGPLIELDKLGMAEDKSRADGEGDQRDESHGDPPMVGGQCFVAFRIGQFGAVITSVEKAMLEGPVLGEIHPAVVFLLPPIMAELANGGRREL